jgi:hypothetical protein
MTLPYRDTSEGRQWQGQDGYWYSTEDGAMAAVAKAAPAPPVPATHAPVTPAVSRPAQTSPTKKVPTARKKRRGLVILLVVVVAVVIAVTTSGGSKPVTHAQKVAAFHSFVSSVEKGLNTCNVAAEDVAVQLGLVLLKGNNPTSSDLVQLDSVARSAQAPCDDTQDNALLNMENESVPGALSGFSNLSTVPTEAGIWATDTGKVLHDIENVAQSSGSGVGAASQLQGDVSTVDGDRSTLRSMFRSVANSLGISFPGLGLMKWSSS